MEAEQDREIVEIFAIYEAAWQRARDDGAGVLYQARWPDRAGFFDARTTVKNGTPVIQIYRVGYADPGHGTSRVLGHRASRVLSDGSIVTEAQLRSELVTFAHEYGHFVSYLRETEREQWWRYYVVQRRYDNLTTRAELTQADRECIIREEALAWRIGRELLVSLGYDDMQMIDSREQHEIHYHRYRLGVDDLWPCDGQTARCNETHR